jgi:uncharacterized membrane protein
MPRHDPYAALAGMADPKNFPRDLAVVILWLVLAIVSVYVPVINASFLRILFTVPVILFIPGYVLIAALFPEKHSIDGIERFALSVGLSIAVVPLIGLALNYTPWGIRLDPIVASLTIFTLLMCVAALYRRAAVPDGERFSVPFEKIKPVLENEFLPDPGAPRIDRILSYILIAAIILAVITTVFVIVTPKEGEKFTEFFILGANKMADSYPESFEAGSPQFVWTGIKNHEYRDVTYTVETLLLSVEWDAASNTSVIHAEKPLARFTVFLADNTTYLEPYNFTVDSTRYNRLEFLLYNETVPPVTAGAQEKMDSAYRDLHLWIRVREPGQRL